MKPVVVGTVVPSNIFTKNELTVKIEFKFADPNGKGVIIGCQGINSALRPMAPTANQGWHPFIYIGGQGGIRYVYARFYIGTAHIMRSNAINLHNSHEVIYYVDFVKNIQTLQVDAQPIQMLAGPIAPQGKAFAQIGTGFTHYWPFINDGINFWVDFIGDAGIEIYDVAPSLISTSKPIFVY